MAFDSLPRDRSYLLLWQSRSAVVIGKHQDALAEIDRAYVEAEQIQVVRRLSGGGAVYHDLGDLNYSYITDAPGGVLDLGRFCRPVLQALRAMGLPVELTGRNDMVLDGRKVSGSAQYVRQGRVMHHGTLLFDTDLDKMARALRADPEKIRSKGVASVRSRVTLLRPALPEDMDMPQFRARLLQELQRQLPGELMRFGAEELRQIDALCRTRYGTWEWTFGASPPCDQVLRRRFEGCGTVEARLRLERGRIAALQFVGDFFSSVEPEELAATLLGCPLEQDALRAALSGTDVSRYLLGLDAERLIALLCQG